MKIRQGFVSNSSSSSFVVFGYEFESDELSDELVESLYDGNQNLTILGADDDVPEGKTVIGVDLFCFDECSGCVKSEIALEDLDEKCLFLKEEILAILPKFSETNRKPKIYAGQKAC